MRMNYAAALAGSAREQVRLEQQACKQQPSGRSATRSRAGAAGDGTRTGEPVPLFDKLVEAVEKLAARIAAMEQRMEQLQQPSARAAGDYKCKRRTHRRRMRRARIDAHVSTPAAANDPQQQLADADADADAETDKTVPAAAPAVAHLPASDMLDIGTPVEADAVAVAAVSPSVSDMLDTGASAECESMPAPADAAPAVSQSPLASDALDAGASPAAGGNADAASVPASASASACGPSSPRSLSPVAFRRTRGKRIIPRSDDEERTDAEEPVLLSPVSSRVDRIVKRIHQQSSPLQQLVQHGAAAASASLVLSVPPVAAPGAAAPTASSSFHPAVAAEVQSGTPDGSPLLL